MLMLQEWEQTANYDPTNPQQARIEAYFALPGYYDSVYYNALTPSSSVLTGASDWLSANWKLTAAMGLLAGGLVAYQLSRNGLRRY